MSLASGPMGAILGLLTLANALFGFRIRASAPPQRRTPQKPPREPDRLSAPLEGAGPPGRSERGVGDEGE
eukprot:CAMPEP_0181177436 /NCGR_PEP_ID=MMETSP1096-20121128/5159_1 /TAXON_ID=156174 ORGANISM="Chrysochromulina ericina, Strain CCMP281" /NCGR_SAMPLE_ID=MMETSP1096 /ASSEMBLY_ACC=CAM_ASM_000453 /LENGTH=69 /DNA_ID=CAMNT_0023265585 /DNA_START=429 /DNA_END=638 /DNA_ORIENTATION=+